ncbi:MAG TPA: isocitrate lyase/phosphoenolpyruvate mutase family protein [Streptosporangiaceae bacterium]
MTDQAGKYEHFLALHQGPAPLLMPNAWDHGSAALLASLGFEAIATTSSGFAATLGQLDNTVTRDQALEHSRAMAAAVSIPVSADLENCFADDPAGVAETVRLAAGTGLAGCSVEDSTGRSDDPIYEPGLAAERVAAAVEAARGSGSRLVLTARAENFLHGRPDLKDTIARLQAYQAAGADVLYAPGLTALDDIRAVVSSVDRPVNVLTFAGTPGVAQLTDAGVRRISVGGAFAYTAYGALADAARELREQGSYGFLAGARTGRAAVQAAFGD